jgi:hypothetical protein
VGGRIAPVAASAGLGLSARIEIAAILVGVAGVAAVVKMSSSWSQLVNVDR